MLLRSIAVLVLIALLWLTGLIDLEMLPYNSREFQVCGATVLLYLFWSAAESRYRGGGSSLPYIVFYSVLLVAALDSFLLELTSYGPPWPLRWAGLLLFTAGSVVRLRAYGVRSGKLLRFGRYLQLAGLPVALGSIAGTAVAVFAGVPGSIHEELPPLEEEEP